MKRRPQGALSMLREAAEWRLRGILLERPAEGWRSEIATLAAETGDESLRRLAQRRLAEASEGEYLAALGPGGTASPREAAYAGLRDPGWILADLARFYEAFGYRPRAEEPPDHVAVEVGFVAYLWLKEVFARERGEGEAAATTRAARERFLAEHLAELAVPLARKLEAADSLLAPVAAEIAAHVPPPQRAAAVEGCAFEGACAGAGIAPRTAADDDFCGP